MIPINDIKQWRQQAPWVYQSQVEQDLILSRALIALYQNERIRHSLAFRGGTALNKLYIQPPSRYSEDLDLVQINDEPIGETLTEIRRVLDPWLGVARWHQGTRSTKLIYRFQSEDSPAVALRLKIEINMIESFTLFGHQHKEYGIESRWFNGGASVTTYALEELMGTKLRALYQRSKGRDLFDLWYCISKLNMDCEKIIAAFNHYNKVNQIAISRAEFEKNLSLKIETRDFISDVSALLTHGIKWEPKNAYSMVMESLIARLHGLPWKKLEKVNV